MNTFQKFGCLTAVIAMALPGMAHAQVIGSYDNFDVFNDTGQTAEGFEIDVEDVDPTQLTREFPSNFAQSWLIRYGLPTVISYDWTSTMPDAAHSYDAGHKGVLVTWAATLQAGAWVAAQGANQSGLGVAGNGTPYNPKPTLTAGESCWWWGLGAAYPASGCEHFGISFAGGVSPGKMTYHWKVPDPTNTTLVNAALEASIPASPVLVVAPPVAPAAPPVIQAVARAPADAGGDPNRPQALEPQFGDAYWVKTVTTYSQQQAQLDNLQIKVLGKLKTSRTISWKLLQRAPGLGANAGMADREDNENDQFPNAKYVQVTKQYQYFKFAGAYDSETHQALCDNFYGSQAATLANGATVQVSCQNAAGNDWPFTRSYWTLDPGPNKAVYSKGGNLGTYLGAHMNAYNVQ